jgi:hypothetical protein
MAQVERQGLRQVRREIVIIPELVIAGGLGRALKIWGKCFLHIHEDFASIFYLNSLVGGQEEALFSWIGDHGVDDGAGRHVAHPAHAVSVAEMEQQLSINTNFARRKPQRQHSLLVNREESGFVTLLGHHKRYPRLIIIF